MPTAQTRVVTDRASRYLVQFCKHAAAMGAGDGHSPRVHMHGGLQRGEVTVTADWSDTHGVVTLTPWGRCTLDAEGDVLTVNIDADTSDGVRQIREIVTRDLQRFSSRQPLTVSWQPPPDEPAPAPSKRRPRWQVLILAVTIAVSIAAHLVLAGTVAAHWATLATTVIVLAIAVKVGLVLVLRAHGRRILDLHHRRTGLSDERP